MICLGESEPSSMGRRLVLYLGVFSTRYPPPAFDSRQFSLVSDRIARRSFVASSRGTSCVWVSIVFRRSWSADNGNEARYSFLSAYAVSPKLSRGEPCPDVFRCVAPGTAHRTKGFFIPSESFVFGAEAMEHMVSETSDASVLLVEAFHGGSHKQLVSTIECLLTRRGEKVCLVTLPPTKWHWRARTGALALAAAIPRGRDFRVMFTSAVFSLAELLALRPDLSAIPRKYVYFHENQLAYPLRHGDTKPDYQFAYIQVLSAVVADLVFFNSEFNMRGFYDRLPAFLGAGLPTPPIPRVPDPRTLVSDILLPKSRVLYFLVDTPLSCSTHEAVRSQAERIRRRGDSHLKILWNHRWEYDKNPVDFFKVIFSLAGITVDEDFFQRGMTTLRPSVGDVCQEAVSTFSTQAHSNLKFTASVLGASNQDAPCIFSMAEPLLRAAGVVSAWGFVESREAYWLELASCDVVVSTAHHEFFGVSVVEAVSVGCVPLLPNRLSYPELVSPANSKRGSDSSLYGTLPQLRKQLRRWITCPGKLRERAAKSLLAAYGIESPEAPWLRPEVFPNGILELEYYEVLRPK
uniref:tRNA-queuosine alpha-mannosyltransferase n=1 Tax=Mesocestoides corti TaxID=53468 RepID=A0A5K3FTR6_MESCO